MIIRKAERSHWVAGMIDQHGRLFERFINKVSFDDECWNWKGKKADGYGAVSINSKIHKAHRLMFGFSKEPILTGLCVRHTCDNSLCVFPHHLITGTHKENMEDRQRRNRGGNHKGINNGRAKLIPEQVLEIRDSSIKNSILARKFGVTKTQIGHIKKLKAWKHI